MSLIVSIFEKSDVLVDTDELEAQVPKPHNNLFGFEICRKTLWGSEQVNELGCELIFSLKEGDIYAFDEELEQLEKEFLVLLDHLDLLQLHSNYRKDFIEFRVKNALEMIKIAIREKDKVGINIG